jgi:putative alpha-1,2-mannosidase
LKDGNLLQIKNNKGKSVLLNDKPIDGFKISHKEIVQGGTLNF